MNRRNVIKGLTGLSLLLVLPKNYLLANSKLFVEKRKKQNEEDFSKLFILMGVKKDIPDLQNIDEKKLIKEKNLYKFSVTHEDTITQLKKLRWKKNKCIEHRAYETAAHYRDNEWLLLSEYFNINILSTYHYVDSSYSMSSRKSFFIEDALYYVLLS